MRVFNYVSATLVSSGFASISDMLDDIRDLHFQASQVSEECSRTTIEPTTIVADLANSKDVVSSPSPPERGMYMAHLDKMTYLVRIIDGSVLKLTVGIEDSDHSGTERLLGVTMSYKVNDKNMVELSDKDTTDQETKKQVLDHMKAVGKLGKEEQLTLRFSPSSSRMFIGDFPLQKDNCIVQLSSSLPIKDESISIGEQDEVAAASVFNAPVIESSVTMSSVTAETTQAPVAVQSTLENMSEKTEIQV